MISIITDLCHRIVLFSPLVNTAGGKTGGFLPLFLSFYIRFYQKNAFPKNLKTFDMIEV